MMKRMDESRTILLTGASGFIGRRFLELLPPCWTAHAVWRSRADFPEFVARLNNPRVIAHRCDLSDAGATADLARAIDAARPGAPRLDAALVLSANGDPVRSAIDPAGDLKDTALTALHVFSNVFARRLVYLSSGAVYEGARGVVSPTLPIAPRLPYAISHYAAERYAAYYQSRGQFEHAVILRFWGAFGPHEPARKIYTRLVRNFSFERRTGMTIRGDGQNLIDAMYVDDAVSALIAVICAPGASGSEVFDFSSGEPMRIIDLARLVAGAFGIADPRFCFEGDVAEEHAFQADPMAFRRRFAFHPKYSIPQGLRGLAEWLSKSPGSHVQGAGCEQ